MGRARVLGVIPARIGSERLPRKPLYLLAGRPLIEWVWLRARGFSALDALVVATDSAEVAERCQAVGADVALTAATHASGTDRVAEVAAGTGYQDFDIVVNIQGDEPFVEEAAVSSTVELVRQGWDVGTVATPIRSLAAWQDPGVVKVVRRADGGALYFSRAPVPWMREGKPSEADLDSPLYLRHIGIYAYGRQALSRWMALPEAELERAERLEQLRALAAGLTIGVALVDAAEPGVDTPEDARRAEERLRQIGTSTIPIPA